MSTEHVAGSGAQVAPVPARDTLPGPGSGRPEASIAWAVATGVLGAGMLVMPPVVAGLAGTDSLSVWTAHILLGGAVSLLLALLVRGRTGPAPLAASTGVLLGRWAERLVDAVYALAFTAGQAAIAWFTAACALAAVEGTVRPPGTAGLLVALGVLGVALALALSPLRLSSTLLRRRPWVTGAVALACAALAWPLVSPDASTPLTLPGVRPEGALWLALAALFFAGVGWEAVTSAVPTTRTTAGRTAAGVGLGVVVVAVVYLGLAAVREAAAPEPLPVWARLSLGATVAVLLTSYCFTNIRTAARIAARLRPDGAGSSRMLVAAVGAVCCGFAVAGGREGAVPLLLLGPALGAFTAYTTGAVAALRHGGPLLRCGAAAVLLALMATAVQTLRVLLSG